MGIVELLLLAVGLSMDAFAVSVYKGLFLKKVGLKECAICALWFGVFQGAMPFVGYILGVGFEKYIRVIAPWLAFILLCLIGANMIKESLSKDDGNASSSLTIKAMFPLAVATSIDALAVGITFACVPVTIINITPFLNTVLAVFVIGITTFIISSIGVKIGNVFGTRYKSKAEFIGGLILILIGSKILLNYFVF